MFDLVAEISMGNEKAFQKAYTLYKSRVYYYALKKKKSEYWAQEILQQTFIRLWTSRTNLAADIDLEVQLFRICKSLVIDAMRKPAGVKIQYVSDYKDHNASVNPDNLIRELEQQVDTIIKSMPTKGKEAFVLSRRQGLTYHEIALQLSLSPKTVEYHISRALQLLKKNLPLLRLLILG